MLQVSSREPFSPLPSPRITVILRALVLLAGMLLLYPDAVSGQQQPALSCEPFAGIPSQCAVVFSPTDEVALPPNVTQTELWGASPLYSYLGLLSSASPSCSAAAFAFLCPAEVFPPCFVDSTTGVPTARRVC